MRLLLDTHAFIWSISKPNKLPDKVRLAIKNPATEVFVSAVSLWEIAIKVRIKKLEPVGSVDENMADIAESTGIQTISLTPAEATTYGALTEKTHNDPFDRMLIWQAIQRDLVLISADSQFERFEPDGLKLFWK